MMINDDAEIQGCFISLVMNDGYFISFRIGLIRCSIFIKQVDNSYLVTIFLTNLLMSPFCSIGMRNEIYCCVQALFQFGLN